jgi:hypothetical protein
VGYGVRVGLGVNVRVGVTLIVGRSPGEGELVGNDSWLVGVNPNLVVSVKRVPIWEQAVMENKQTRVIK